MGDGRPGRVGIPGPTNDPSRGRFEKQFEEMAGALLECQQPDGLWRSSLLDPQSYPLKETSGSGFHTYALAWGVNQGLLDRGTYGPAVRKAWAALVACVAPDGKLTHVQPIGADPRKFDPDKTEIYGVGAFLLAGSEVYRMALTADVSPATVKVKNPADFQREAETAAVSLKNLPDTPAIMDALTSRILDSQIVEEQLLFQVDLAPGETREYLAFPRAALAAVPQPVVKTYARFVPERKDDFAWESDRIAFRVYGPALMTDPQEPLTSSGVDVWVKRTRNLIIDKWYRLGDYHKDHGEGLDGYSVGPTRGCGGLGIWNGANLFVSQNYRTHRLIATGPIRSVFELTFEDWDAAGRTVSEVKRLSIDANSNFTRSESRFSSDRSAPLSVGVGIVQRSGEGKIARDEALGFLSYWEPEKPPNGNTGCAVILPAGLDEFTTDGTNLLAIATVQPGKPFTYYFGGAWSKSGDFDNATDLENHVRKFVARLRTPLEVTVRQ